MTTPLTRRGFLIGTVASAGSALVIPRARAEPSENSIASECGVAYVVDVGTRNTRSAERWVEDVLLSPDAGCAAMAGEPSMLEAATIVNSTLRCRRLLLHSPVHPSAGIAAIDAMRRVADRFPIDGWDIRPWTDGAVHLDGLEPCLIVAVRLGIRIVTMRLPPGDVAADVERIAHGAPDVSFVLFDASGSATTATLAAIAQKPRNLWLTIGDDSSVLPLVEAFGDERLLWGTRGETPELAGALRQFASTSTQTRARILGENAAKLYGLDPEDIVPIPDAWRSELRRREEETT